MIKAVNIKYMIRAPTTKHTITTKYHLAAVCMQRGSSRHTLGGFFIPGNQQSTFLGRTSGRKRGIYGIF